MLAIYLIYPNFNKFKDSFTFLDNTIVEKETNRIKKNDIIQVTDIEEDKIVVNENDTDDNSQNERYLITEEIENNKSSNETILEENINNNEQIIDNPDSDNIQKEKDRG